MSLFNTNETKPSKQILHTWNKYSYDWLCCCKKIMDTLKKNNIKAIAENVRPYSKDIKERRGAFCIEPRKWQQTRNKPTI